MVPLYTLRNAALLPTLLRGLALPLLQRRHTPLTASLILGALWGIWHAPAWLLSGSEQAAWSVPAFFVGVLAIAVIVTPMFNAAGGSILVAALFHFQVNNPVWPDAQPWDTLVYVARRGRGGDPEPDDDAEPRAPSPRC